MLKKTTLALLFYSQLALCMQPNIQPNREHRVLPILYAGFAATLIVFGILPGNERDYTIITVGNTNYQCYKGESLEQCAGADARYFDSQQEVIFESEQTGRCHIRRENIGQCLRRHNQK